MDATDFSDDDASFCSFDDSVSDSALLGTFQEDDLQDTTGHGQQEDMKVTVDFNLYSDTIHVPMAMVQSVSEHLNSTLKFEKCDDVRNGEIYKTANRSATVTLYVTTGSIHVQGPSHSEMTDNLYRHFRKMNDDAKVMQQIGHSQETEVKQIADPERVHTSQEETEVKQLADPEHVCASQEDTEVKQLLDSEPVRASTPIGNESLDIEYLKQQTEALNEFVTMLTERLEVLESGKLSVRAGPTLMDASTQTDIATERTDTETQTEPIPTDSRLRTTVSRAQGSPERAVLSNLVSGTPMDSPDRAMPSNLFSGSPTDVDTTRHDTTLQPTSQTQDSHDGTGQAEEPEPVTKPEREQSGPTEPKPDQSPLRPVPTYAEIVKRQNDKDASRYLHNSATLRKTERETSTDGKTLIIGSSLVRDIKRRGLAPNVEVNTRSGARISDIRTELERRRIEKYSNIIIQAGGNDVDGRREYEAIENDFAEIIQDIHRRTPQTNVFIAEILPRRRLDMTDINKILGKVCELYGAKLIQTTKTFPRVNAAQFLGDNLH